MTTQSNGLGMGLHNISRLSHATTRSISAENPTGEKGRGATATEGTGTSAARDLGQGWKVSPSIMLEPGTTVTLADISGPGAIQHIWSATVAERWRWLILRVYWDDEPTPSIEAPFGDFFCNGWRQPCNVTSLPITVNPKGGLNSF